MQLESRIISSLGEEPLRARPAPNRRERVQQILSQQAKAKPTPQETKLDIIFAAVILGMTVQFVAFIFGMVTAYLPRLFDIALVSIIIGLCVSAISYALMKESD
ncbi:MAG: hypothetical protein ACREEM_16725 [Blastocatellia bacterium]